MKKLWVPLVFLSILVGCSRPSQVVVLSPNGQMKVSVSLGDSGMVHYSVLYGNDSVLLPSRLGIVMADEDFSRNLSWQGVSAPLAVSDRYELLTGKQAQVTYQANEQVVTLHSSSGKVMEVVFRVSNNGVAFRYRFPQADDASVVRSIVDELTSFHFPDSTKSWLQPMSEAKTGWCQTNNSYEEHYVMEVAPGTPAPLKAGWIYPALFNSGDVWTLISETDLHRHYCGTRLVDAGANTFKVGFPDPREAFTNGGVNPQSVLPWQSPWRIMAVGNLGNIVESTLGTDLAAPAIDKDFSFVKPGIASWSWAILKDNSVNYDTQKRFIDFAADMHWAYCLVDVNWDRNIGYDKMKELADYAASKNVGLILWYNSSGDWNSTEYTPKSMLLTREARRAEFERIRQMGIKGIKVDFFGGDGQSMIQYYHDIFEDAADHQLMVNCHGATLSRGWQRTYPNLVTIEAIKGFEFITFEQQNADLAPSHCALLPFTRNVFDPMDFTPMNLSSIPGINRRTTYGFELALPVLFTSGVQHMAETPDGLAGVPDFVKSFLQNLPSRWNASRFIDGYPGKYVVMARQADNGWYVMAINGENSPRQLSVDASFAAPAGTLITDGSEADSFVSRDVNQRIDIELKPYGGFVAFYPNVN